VRWLTNKHVVSRPKEDPKHHKSGHFGEVLSDYWCGFDVLEALILQVTMPALASAVRAWEDKQLT
jgi:hypothetical protein